MLNSVSGTSGTEIVFFNDGETPTEFVSNLLLTVFGKDVASAMGLISEIESNGRAASGPYPPEVADALHASAIERIKKEGYRLKLEKRVVERATNLECAFCGKAARMDQTLYQGISAAICDECLLVGAGSISQTSTSRQFHYAFQALAWHFAGISKDRIVSTSRKFPGHMRADVQVAIDQLFTTRHIRLFGVHEEHRYETLTLSGLMKESQHPSIIAPLEFEDVDTGEAEPVKCMNNGLWLCVEGGVRYAAVLSGYRDYGQETGVRLEIAVPGGEEGAALASRLFKAVSEAVNQSRAYRGKALSLEVKNPYSGFASGMAVHKLPRIDRDDVILSETTLRLLDRNIFDFVKSREGLRKLGLSTRKGILLYGPPGTGKTHTIRYLASNLHDHTTLIITEAQVGLLSEYMHLARLLQPSMVVIEDVDLIGRDREQMSGPCEESMLNKLLNEMDGLKEDADIIFVLTTNRPEQLEMALAGRPGRVDQAIEIPLPDELCRKRLTRLYGSRLDLSDEVVSEVARKTQGVSAAFIKETMRRTAQQNIERGGGGVSVADVTAAVDDMLFTGGQLNVKLLGGAAPH
jgi:ATP-dependent Clp protease adapter protein ClpS